MKFFFPDSQDLVDPSFDFKTEQRASDRVRHRDDTYAHEVFSAPAYDGLLVSKGIVDGFGPGSTRYTLAQRHRLLRVGAKEFFRLDRGWGESLPVMGDCGAFTYVREKDPPYSVDQVLDFYVECKFDLGISVDHVILAYQSSWDDALDCVPLVPPETRQRQDITLQLASEFLGRHTRSGLPFQPLGVAQGWSPKSYAAAVSSLQKMGYKYIALGGMVPLKTREIVACLEAISSVRRPETRFHLLGVTRVEEVSRFAAFGIASFDSTSPLRQAFKDEKNNYYTLDRTYSAVRVPQVEGNPGLQRRIKAGLVAQGLARRLESACLDSLERYDRGEIAVHELLRVLREYEEVCDPEHDHTEVYREVLEAKPWRDCPCDVCRALGYHVVLFRGAERNRRRGFHNVWVFYRRLQRQLGLLDAATPDTKGRKTAGVNPKTSRLTAETNG